MPELSQPRNKEVEKVTYRKQQLKVAMTMMAVQQQEGNEQQGAEG